MSRSGSVLSKFFKSLRTGWKQQSSVQVGVDRQGNKYFERPINEVSEQRHAKRSMRYVLLPEQQSLEEPWMQLSGNIPNVPNEWDMWLRHKRVEPPTEEEIIKNEKLVIFRRYQGKLFDEKHKIERQKMIEKGELHEMRTEEISFPVYQGMEIRPGEGIIDPATQGRAGLREINENLEKDEKKK